MRSEREMVVPDGHMLIAGDGSRYPAGTRYHHIVNMREVRTNGSGMFGPADGVERVIGRVVDREWVVVDGEPLAWPWTLQAVFG